MAGPVARAAALLAGYGAPAAPDMEDGLTLETTYAIGAVLTSTAVANGSDPLRNQPAVFACDFTGLDGEDAGGVIMDCGAGGNGCYIGFRADGSFVCRSGSGGTAPAANIAEVTAAAGAIAGSGTLVWAFDGIGSAVRARVWWNGVLVGSDTSSYTGSWTGSDPGGYLPGTDDGSNGVSISGEYYPGALPTYSTASTLRYYENQTIA